MDKINAAIQRFSDATSEAESALREIAAALKGAKPAPYVPKVGDVIKFRQEGPSAAERIVIRVHPYNAGYESHEGDVNACRLSNKNLVGLGKAWDCIYLRPATPSEREAAGIPASPPAPAPVVEDAPLDVCDRRAVETTFPIGSFVRVVKSSGEAWSQVHPIGAVRKVRGYDQYSGAWRLLVEDNKGFVLCCDAVEVAPAPAPTPAMPKVDYVDYDEVLAAMREAIDSWQHSADDHRKSHEVATDVAMRFLSARKVSS